VGLKTAPTQDITQYMENPMADLAVQPTRFTVILKPIVTLARRIKALAAAEPVPYWTDYLNGQQGK
jgi:hypothetical protein